MALEQFSRKLCSMFLQFAFKQKLHASADSYELIAKGWAQLIQFE